jgi:hypothetical protein
MAPLLDNVVRFGLLIAGNHMTSFAPKQPGDGLTFG